MVIIAVKDQKLTSLMIDGYVESVDFLRNLNWKEWEKKGYLPSRWYWHHLYRNLRVNKYYNESNNVSAFLTSVYGFLYKYCPLDRKERIKNCKLRGYTYSWYQKKSRTKLRQKMPFIAKEQEYDNQNGRERYLQIRVIHHDSPNCNYDKLLECCSNWINKLSFNIKPRGYYKNHSDFESFWIAEMKQLTPL